MEFSQRVAEGGLRLFVAAIDEKIQGRFDRCLVHWVPTEGHHLAIDHLISNSASIQRFVQPFLVKRCEIPHAVGALSQASNGLIQSFEDIEELRSARLRLRELIGSGTRRISSSAPPDTVSNHPRYLRLSAPYHEPLCGDDVDYIRPKLSYRNPGIFADCLAPEDFSRRFALCLLATTPTLCE